MQHSSCMQHAITTMVCDIQYCTHVRYATELRYTLCYYSNVIHYTIHSWTNVRQLVITDGMTTCRSLEHPNLCLSRFRRIVT